MLGHLGALIPCQRAARFFAQGCDSARDGVTNSLCTMPGQGRSILGSRYLTVAAQKR